MPKKASSPSLADDDSSPVFPTDNGDNNDSDNGGSGSNDPGYGGDVDSGGSSSLSIDCTIYKSNGFNFDCREFKNLIVHGYRNANTSNQIGWSSEDLNSINQDKLSTDSEFNLRVISRSGPSQGTIDSRGDKCEFQPMPFEKLSMTVGIKAPGSSQYYDSYEFKAIPVGAVSKVYKFNVPPGLLDPPVIEVRDIKWDYGENGMEGVWGHDCVRFDLQLSTDETKSFNRPSIN